MYSAKCTVSSTVMSQARVAGLAVTSTAAALPL